MEERTAPGPRIAAAKPGQPTRRRATGPRSERGKQRSSQNAIGPGIFAKAILIQGESSREFCSLLRRLMGDVQGLEEVERILRQELGCIFWRKARFLKAEAAEIAKATEFADLGQLANQGFNFGDSSSLQIEGLQGRGEHVGGTKPPRSVRRKQALVLPSPEILERYMAYERHLRRQVYWVLDQIERVRRMRLENPALSTLRERTRRVRRRRGHTRCDL